MHGIFVGEIQALEGAGRTAYDYSSPDEVPYALKLDMARQCWDEARHVEISVKLGDHMGTEIGEYAESVTLFEASCHADPIFRLAGVNRALEGLAIDVFTTMRDFADVMTDPVLRFCEDWMLADEVTHVKMGSRWLREVTEDDPERRAAALEFQRTVDGLFNFGGRRGEDEQSSIRLARKFPRDGRLHHRRDRRDRRPGRRTARRSGRIGLLSRHSARDRNSPRYDAVNSDLVRTGLAV